MIVRVVCCRMGDNRRKPLRVDSDLQECSQCGLPIWVNLDSIERALAISSAYELWCLECNHADSSVKIWVPGES
jgi:hypothetical protein